MTEGAFIRVPAATREEIGELASYLEQGLRSLRQVTEHLRGSSETMPSVLDDLRDVMRMTEAATERVLDETEALVDDGRAASRLLAEVRRTAGASGLAAVDEPMAQLGALIERSNGRAMEIMSALEFQDLTSQKVQRTFAVLEQVLVRLAKIRHLVDVNGDPPAAKPRAVPATPQDGKSAQRLADELLLHYSTRTDA
jgi:chemotaxis regulatin CheY-phosphate phosphatase CheZ